MVVAAIGCDGVTVLAGVSGAIRPTPRTWRAPCASDGGLGRPRSSPNWPVARSGECRAGVQTFRVRPSIRVRSRRYPVTFARGPYPRAAGGLVDRVARVGASVCARWGRAGAAVARRLWRPDCDILWGATTTTSERRYAEALGVPARRGGLRPTDTAGSLPWWSSTRRWPALFPGRSDRPGVWVARQAFRPCPADIVGVSRRAVERARRTGRPKPGRMRSRRPEEILRTMFWCSMSRRRRGGDAGGAAERPPTPTCR